MKSDPWDPAHREASQSRESGSNQYKEEAWEHVANDKPSPPPPWAKNLQDLGPDDDKGETGIAEESQLVTPSLAAAGASGSERARSLSGKPPSEGRSVRLVSREEVTISV